MSASLWCEEEAERSGAWVRASLDPSASGLRVIQSLLHLEEKYLPSPLYVSLIQSEPGRREELTKWTLEVCCECGCEESVFPLAVSLLDRYLSCTLALPVSPTCLASACVLVASKLAESETVTADTLCASAEYAFLSSELRGMERVVLGTLRWDVAAVTPQDFLPHFLSCLEELMGEDAPGLAPTLRRHADTLAAMCACDWRFLGAPPSLVAAAVLSSALGGLEAQGGPVAGDVTHALAALCRRDSAVLQCYSELVEGALRERLRSRGGRQAEKDGGGPEEERSSTPTDLREIDF